jgi:PAS domain S-box-containing protein
VPPAEASVTAVLAEIFAQTETAVAVVDRTHRVQAWNPGAEALFRWSASEATGQDIVELLGTEDCPLRRYIGSALLGDVVQGVPVKLQRRTGGALDLILSCRGTGGRSQDNPAAVLFIDSVTRNQTVAGALAQRTREFHELIGAFPDLFLWAAQDGRILDYHIGTEVDLAVAPDQFLGRRMGQIVPPDTGQQLEEAIARALQDQQVQTVEYELLRPSGMRRLETRIVPIGADRVVAVVRNVTEQRRMEDQIRRGQRMEAIARLTGGVAHDFNNLLMVVQACATSLQPALQDRPDELALVDELELVADKATLLIRHLLSFSQRQAAAPTLVDLNALTRDNARLVERLLREDTQLVFDAAPQPVWVLADPVHLEQVLYNLCINARDAMPFGGRLSLRVDQRAAEPPGTSGSAALTVRDSGIGMDPDLQSHVFEPFFTTKAEGNGLGLSTVHDIVEQAGGSIEVASAPGQGTTITVLLPLREPPRGAAPAVGHGDGASTRSQGGETVLLVEDDPDLAHMVALILSGAGYQVLSAFNTDAALATYQRNRDAIRLVISDVIMPGRSGHELAAELHQLQPALPIVLMTGYDNDPAAAPDNVLLRKPVTPDALLRQVRALLDAARTP